jgi:hypothetical protein
MNETQEAKLFEDIGSIKTSVDIHTGQLADIYETVKDNSTDVAVLKAQRNNGCCPALENVKKEVADIKNTQLIKVAGEKGKDIGKKELLGFVWNFVKARPGVAVLIIIISVVFSLLFPGLSIRMMKHMPFIQALIDIFVGQ